MSLMCELIYVKNFSTVRWNNCALCSWSKGIETDRMCVGGEGTLGTQLSVAFICYQNIPLGHSKYSLSLSLLCDMQNLNYPVPNNNILTDLFSCCRTVLCDFANIFTRYIQVEQLESCELYSHISKHPEQRDQWKSEKQRAVGSVSIVWMKSSKHKYNGTDPSSHCNVASERERKTSSWRLRTMIDGVTKSRCIKTHIAAIIYVGEIAVWMDNMKNSVQEINFRFSVHIFGSYRAQTTICE